MGSSIGLRKISIKIDGEVFTSFERVPIDPNQVHHRAVHYSRTTRCGLAITKKSKTESNLKWVTCPDCLRLHLSKLYEEVKFYEGLLGEVTSQKGQPNANRRKRSMVKPSRRALQNEDRKDRC